jgi:hypothetical protein
VLAAALLFSGCGGGDSSSGGDGGAPATYSIGGSITGLTAAGLVLANGSDTVSPAAGATSFTFATALTSGSGYAVMVKTQPNSGLCQVTNGSGQVGSVAVTKVIVTCKAATYTIGGTITGLSATGLVLANGTDTVSPSAGATSFTFATAETNGWSYAVTVETQPNSELCQVANGSGQVGSVAVTNVIVTCKAATYTIGGTITGLSAAGLVLANGIDSVSPAAGATSFTFATALTSGSSYAVTVKTQPNKEVCQVANGSGQVGSIAVTNVMVICGHPWTWVSGANTVNAKGIYGTRGIAAAGNVPGARGLSVSWIDSSGDLWLLGGLGYDWKGTNGNLNDLWRYSPGSRQWTWVSGSNTAGAPGMYGTKGIPAAGNVPGARERAVSWIDRAGDLWLFGGSGVDSAGTSGDLNDLWRYSPRSGLWIWVSGSNTVGANGVYGIQGIPAANNMPSARRDSVSWVDSAGDLWLFGGIHLSYRSGGLNDLWRYSQDSGQWTWVSGSNTAGATGVYGIQGIAAVGNVPGARAFSVSWTDSAGDLWLFGGLERPFAPLFNDLWRYSPGTGLWTWVSGSNTGDAGGVYGTQGIPAAGNVPGARDLSVSWIDSAGDLWLFGGVPGWTWLDDLWRYSPGSGEWTWVSGLDTGDANGVYGTRGTAAGMPGGRGDAVSWIDSAGHLWLFGGYGYDSAGTVGSLNDLWVF